jgi:hypothetical protein
MKHTVRVAVALLVGVGGMWMLWATMTTSADATPTAMAPRARAADRSCGEIVVAHAFYAVAISRGGVVCATARRVLREFMGGGGVEHGGPSAAQMVWSLGRWRCGFGAGGGGCIRGGSNTMNAGSVISAEWTAWVCGYKPSGAKVPCERLLPRLRPNRAKYYLKVALRRRFGNWAYATGYSSGCRRSSRTSVRCRPAWHQLENYFHGNARIWLTRKRGHVWWNYAWRLKRLNDHCYLAQHRPKPQCTTVFMVK